MFSFTVPLFEKLHPHYYIKVISDRWIQSEVVYPISLRNLILPDMFLPQTQLLDRQMLPIASLKNKAAEAQLLALNISEFNPIQTQVFETFYQNSTDNIFLGAPSKSGKTICAILALLKMFHSGNGEDKAVFISPYESSCLNLVNRLAAFFSPLGKRICQFNG